MALNPGYLLFFTLFILSNKGLSSEKNPISECENKLCILMSLASYQSNLVFIFVKIFKLGQIPKLTNEICTKGIFIDKFFNSAFIGLIHEVVS